MILARVLGLRDFTVALDVKLRLDTSRDNSWLDIFVDRDSLASIGRRGEGSAAHYWVSLLPTYGSVGFLGLSLGYSLLD